MRTQRQVVDYSLQRRALLREVYAGRVGSYEVCDASPYLKSAARFHGEATEVHCPVCRRDNLTLVHYVYGDELKTSAGQARTPAELPVMAMTLREFQVFVVEVCRSCGWNHLVEQYLLGRDGLVDEEAARPAAAMAAGGRGGGGRTGGRAGDSAQRRSTHPSQDGAYLGGELQGESYPGGALPGSGSQGGALRRSSRTVRRRPGAAE